MERTSEVIWRNRDALQGQAVLLVNMPPDVLADRLDCRLSVSTQDFADHRRFAQSRAECRFELLPAGVEEADTVILHLPREKERLLMLSHWLAEQLQESSRLWVVGEIRGGIKSATRHLKNYFGRVNKRDAARHCGLIEASKPLALDPFELQHWFSRWSFEFAHSTIEMQSLPGVFAHGRLDPGTRLLLDSLAALPVGGRVLDFAAGSGVIGIALCALNVDTQLELTLLDVSASALASASVSTEQNGVEATLLASDGASELEGSFDWIVSNPPFHRGIQQTLDVTQKFFADAGTFLSENGRIVIVCNRHLPYEEALRSQFRQVSRLAMNNEFSVFQASQPVR